MNKKLSLIISVLLVVVLFATVLAACTPKDPDIIVDTGLITDYGVVPLANLNDYAATATASPVVYIDKTAVQSKLAAKIKTEKSYYDAYGAYLLAPNEAATYQVYTAEDLTTGTATALKGRFEADKIVEQSSLIKILAHADAEQLIAVLGYSGLNEAKMVSLVEYLSTDGANAKADANIKKATGLIEDYLAARDWSDLATDTSTADGKKYYKQSAWKSRAMNGRLFATGMDGGDFGRVALEMFQYTQVVADAMRVADGDYTTMSDYFKKELLDYDSLVLIRANNDIRWGNDGQTLSAVVKDVTLIANSYDGSYAKPNGANGTDQGLVRAYGYSYDYEKANYNALSEEDFGKNLDYRFMDTMSDDQAKDFRRIQREQYAKSYRYSADFYKTAFYPALKPLNERQEIYEAKVYGFNNNDRDGVTSGTVLSGATAYTVTGVGGNETEQLISVVIGAEIGSYAKETQEGVEVGIADQLAMGDMEYYYWGQDENTIAQAAAQRQYSSTEAAAQAEGEFTLKYLNLKMGDFILKQFLGNDNSAGLANITKAQTRGYRGDYIRMIKAYRRQTVREVAKLVKAGRLTENYSAGTLTYTLNGAYTADEIVSVRDEIGRASAMINGLSNNLARVTVDGQYSHIASTNWALIGEQIKATVDYDYNSLGEGMNWGKKSQTLEDLLIHKNADGSYDTNWETSVFISNNEEVLMYSTGYVRINYQVPTSVNASGAFTEGEHEIVYVPSGDTLGSVAIEKAFGTVSTSSGTPVTYGAPANMTTYYLKYDETSKKYFYPVQTTDTVSYDLTLHVKYEQK